MAFNRHPVDGPLFLTIMNFYVGGFPVIQTVVEKAGIIHIPTTADLMAKRTCDGVDFSTSPILSHNPLTPVDKHGRLRIFAPYQFEGLNDLLFLVISINTLIH